MGNEGVDDDSAECDDDGADVVVVAMALDDVDSDVIDDEIAPVDDDTVVALVPATSSSVSTVLLVIEPSKLLLLAIDDTATPLLDAPPDRYSAALLCSASFGVVGAEIDSELALRSIARLGLVGVDGASLSLLLLFETPFVMTMSCDGCCTSSGSKLISSSVTSPLIACVAALMCCSR